MKFSGKVTIKRPQFEGKVLSEDIVLEYEATYAVSEAVDVAKAVIELSEQFIDAMANSYRKVQQYEKEFNPPTTQNAEAKKSEPATKEDLDKVIRYADKIVGDAFKESTKESIKEA